jgi:hypothetical protein
MVEAIGRIDETRALTALVQNARRADELARLRRVAEDPGSRERELQQMLEQMPWIFGGDFLSVATRRSLTVLDQLDIPLIRADGSLHGVELKQPRIKRLVYRHRNHLVAGPYVSQAASQAMNYLRSLDEQYHVIRGELGIDCRRSSMTVVIGDSRFAPEGITSNDVLETLRTLNSHLVRVEVVTYDQLVDRAAHVLSIAEPAQAPLPSGP